MSGARQWRRRSEASYGPETGTTYLLHFTDAEGNTAAYKHAGHYIGWTDDLAARLKAHAEGRGARLTEVIRAAGLGFRLARTWPETTRDTEDSLKHQGGARRFCPECGVTPRQASAPRRERPAAKAAEKPSQVPGYEFQDWPELTAGLSPDEAVELAAELAKGARAAYQAAAAAWSTTEYQARFDTATEVEMAAMKAVREQAERAGDDPAGAVRREWKEARGAAAETAGQAVRATAGMDADAGATRGNPDAPDHPCGAPEFTGADPETEPFGWSQPEPQDGGRFPLPRVLDADAIETAARSAESRESGRPLAPEAATLADGTPHADPFLAGRGWQAQGGVYVRREAERELEAG